MGVKLHDIIISRNIDYQYLKGKILAVDAPNIIMSLLNFTRKTNITTQANLFFDRTQRVINHLYGILYRVKFFYSKKIFPIFCFDGKVSELKRTITKDQLNDYRFAKERYKRAIKQGNKELARNLAVSPEFFWPYVIEESKHLLGLLGIPYIESPASAEAQCAALVKEKIAYFSNSQDYDSLLFGCPHIIRNLSKSLRKKIKGKWIYKKVIPQTINLNENLKNLGIDQFQLADLGILIGTDYHLGIQNIGPKTGLKLIKEYQNIETIISHTRDKYEFSQLDQKTINQIRKIFLLPDIITKKYLTSLIWSHPDKQNILTFLCKNHFLNQERVKNNLDKLISEYQNSLNYIQNAPKKPQTIQLTLDNLF
ncbi:MAG: flap structure-specific endonuclease [Candidatus Lokiarchaeota archaeon]